jgi:FkbM family methyltransferase
VDRQRIAKMLPQGLRRPTRRAVIWAEIAAARVSRHRIALPPTALDCVIAKNKYGVYCVPSAVRHRPAAQVVLQSRVWEPATIDLMRSVDPDGDVVHAGTFYGDFLPALASARGNGALVWGFEPSRESYRCAQITILLNGLENVVLTHAALGAIPGTALLATSDRAGVPAGGLSRIVKDPSVVVEGRTHENAQVVALDDVIGSDRQVALIQLDVEGYEPQALAGSIGTITRCRPLILVESLPDEAWFAENLAPFGYEATGFVNANRVIRCRS